MQTMIELQLLINGELMKSEYVNAREFRFVERKRFQWIQLYGLNKKLGREWEIVIVVPSTMGIGKPISFPKKDFPYLEKLKKQTDESEQSDQISQFEQSVESEPGHCFQCYFEWRSFQIVADATR